MSDSIKAWHDDIEEYQKLCSMYLEKPKCTDVNYKHFSELKDRRIKEETLANANKIKLESGNNSDFRWTYSTYDKEVRQIDITKTSMFCIDNLFDTRELAVQSLEEQLKEQLGKMKSRLHQYVLEEEKKITILEYKIDTLK